MWLRSFSGDPAWVNATPVVVLGAGEMSCFQCNKSECASTNVFGYLSDPCKNWFCRSSISLPKRVRSLPRRYAVARYFSRTVAVAVSWSISSLPVSSVLMSSRKFGPMVHPMCSITSTLFLKLSRYCCILSRPWLKAYNLRMAEWAVW